MFLHPSIHLELARRRRQDLLAAAERRRIAKAPADDASALGRRVARPSDSRLDASRLRSLLAAAIANAIEVSHVLTAAEKPATVDER
jgi:hypothetical protein